MKKQISKLHYCPFYQNSFNSEVAVELAELDAPHLSRLAEWTKTQNPNRTELKRWPQCDKLSKLISTCGLEDAIKAPKGDTCGGRPSANKLSWIQKGRKGAVCLFFQALLEPSWPFNIKSHPGWPCQIKESATKAAEDGTLLGWSFHNAPAFGTVVTSSSSQGQVEPSQKLEILLPKALGTMWRAERLGSIPGHQGLRKWEPFSYFSHF